MIFSGDKKSIFVIINTVFTMVFLSCNNNDQKAVRTIITPVKTVLMQPFRFHKVIEVSPGNSFDVFSWGRGSTQTGSFLILASDSSEAKYTTTTGDLDGTVTDVYNTDMDMDGNPEVLVQAKSKDSTIFTQIYAFEFKDHKAQKLDFPKLTRSEKKGYHGDDNFYIKDGALMREFPVLDKEDSTAKPGKRILEYGIRNNNFTVKTVSKEEENPKNALVSNTEAKENIPAIAAVFTSKNTSQKQHHRKSKKIVHQRSSNRSSKKHRKRHNG